jgi:hypothetical protein
MEEKANMQVAEGLYRYADDQKIHSRKHEFLPLPLSIGQKVVYWHSLVLVADHIPIVPFFDPRRSVRLTPEARRFVLSMMHERVRVADPDFEKALLAIFQTGSPQASGWLTPAVGWAIGERRKNIGGRARWPTSC